MNFRDSNTRYKNFIYWLGISLPGLKFIRDGIFGLVLRHCSEVITPDIHKKKKKKVRRNTYISIPKLNTKELFLSSVTTTRTVNF